MELLIISRGHSEADHFQCHEGRAVFPFRGGRKTPFRFFCAFVPGRSGSLTLPNFFGNEVGGDYMQFNI